MKKLTLLIGFFLYFNSTNASDFFPVQEVKFNITGNNIQTKLDETLSSPEKLLKLFNPAGAKISKKEVQNNHIKFYATKTVLLISKTVLVRGVLENQSNNNGCATGEFGQDIIFDFAGSDGLVYDNVDRLEVKLCTKQINEKSASVVARPKIFKGRNYSNTMGAIARDMIQAQISPLIQALKTAIQ